MLSYYIKIIALAVITSILFVFSRYAFFKLLGKQFPYPVMKSLVFTFILALIIFTVYSLEYGKLNDIDELFNQQLENELVEVFASSFFIASDLYSLENITNGQNSISMEGLDCVWSLQVSSTLPITGNLANTSNEYTVKLETKCNPPFTHTSYNVDSIRISYSLDSVSKWLMVDTAATSNVNFPIMPWVTRYESIIITDQTSRINVFFVAFPTSSNRLLSDSLVFDFEMNKFPNSSGN